MTAGAPILPIQLCFQRASGLSSPVFPFAALVYAFPPTSRILSPVYIPLTGIISRAAFPGKAGCAFLSLLFDSPFWRALLSCQVSFCTIYALSAYLSAASVFILDTLFISCWRFLYLIRFRDLSSTGAMRSPSWLILRLLFLEVPTVVLSCICNRPAGRCLLFGVPFLSFGVFLI